MSLRTRLVVALLLTAMPVIVALALFQVMVERWAGDQMLKDTISSRLESIGREQCDADPAALGREPLWPGPRRQRPPSPQDRFPPGGPWPRGPRMTAYNDGFRSADPSARAFPPELRARLTAGTDWASVRMDIDGRPHHVGAMRTRWPKGSCAYVVAAWPAPPRRWGLEPALLFAAVVALFLAAVWVAMGPVVRRVRALAHDVRESAASRYTKPVLVEGHDEIADLAQAFATAGVELRLHIESVERREEVLRSFLAHTTHDVMIPLTVLQGHIAAMRQRVSQGSPVLPEHVAGAADEADYLGALLHNLSAAAKLEAGQGLIQSDPVSLGALVERTVLRHRPLAGTRGLTLEFAIPPDAPVYAQGDLTLLEQAVGNLVANAIRHNEGGQHVAVSLETVRGTPPLFRLRVVDDGPGVPDEVLARLGERGYRTDAARQRHPEGLGLGLHIACTVALRHGFTLRFGHAEGGGLAAVLEGTTCEAPAAASTR